MAIGIYLTFDGNAREAVDFYSEVFEVEKNDIMTYGDMPSDPNISLSEKEKKSIMNTKLTISGTDIMFSDTVSFMEEAPFNQGNNISLMLTSEDGEYIKKVFNKLKENGKVKTELKETSWSKLFGDLEDKFGIIWELNQGYK